VPTSARPSIVLLLVLSVALACGAAASLLIGAATSSGYTASPAVLVTLPNWLLADLLLGVGVAIIAAVVYQRIFGARVPFPRRALVTILVTMLLAVIFIAVAHTLVAGGPAANGKVVGPPLNNSSSGSANGSGSGATGTGPGGFLWSPSIPGWVPFVLIAGVAIAAIAVALPQARVYLEARRRRSTPSEEAPSARTVVRIALERAEKELSDGDDPRSAILELYEAVLVRLTSMVGSVELDTPEEIRTTHLVRLGIRPTSAETLTRLFEEARYSSHLLPPEASERARAAVREALDDLARTPGPA
jgi:hypothetical protein